MKTSSLFILLIASVIFSTSLVTGLFLASEKTIERNNSFIRRYPHHPVNRQGSFDLGFNSYYLAGSTRDSIYLGNFTAPLHLLAIDKELSDTSQHRLHLKNMEEYDFRSVKIQVQEPYYYLFDGAVPVIYQGEIGNWIAEGVMENAAYFSQIVPVDNNHFVVRARSTANNENELGQIKVLDSTEVKLKPELLEKQIDGIFDVDGFLIYNQQLKEVIYLYRYRNEYIVANKNLDLQYRGKTIDTISRAQLDIAAITSKNQKKLGPMSTRVNLNATTSGHYLLVSSNRIGKYEDEEMLKQASIIDVYNIEERTYELSFYLYHFKKDEIREFFINEGMLYSLNGNYLVKHTMKEQYFDFETNKNISADIRSKTENLTIE